METGNSRVVRTVLLLCVAIVISVSLFAYSLIHRQMTPAQLRTLGAFVYDPPRTFQPVNLIDHRQQAFGSEQLVGKWSLVFFGYTYCPDICPTTLAMLRQVVKKFDEVDPENRPQIVLVSVDPGRDTPDKLAQYVSYFDPAFIGVTGEFLDLHRFARQLNSAFQKQPGGGQDYLVDHSSNIAIINPRGHYHGFLKPPFKDDFLVTAVQEIQKQF